MTDVDLVILQKVLGEQVKAKRLLHKPKKQSLADASKEMGLSMGNLYRLENGEKKEMSLQTFYAVVKWLGVSADDLLGLQKTRVPYSSHTSAD